MDLYSSILKAERVVRNRSEPFTKFISPYKQVICGIHLHTSSVDSKINELDKSSCPRSMECVTERGRENKKKKKQRLRKAKRFKRQC